MKSYLQEHCLLNIVQVLLTEEIFSELIKQKLGKTK